MEKLELRATGGRLAWAAKDKIVEVLYERSPGHPSRRAEASGGPIGHHATPSGPNRRIKEMPLCVSEAAFFENPAWLKVGFELLQWLATFGRDYLLPKLKPNFAVFEKKMAEYADVVAVSAAILQRAGIPAIAQGFWTERSERAG